MGNPYVLSPSVSDEDTQLNEVGPGLRTRLEFRAGVGHWSIDVYLDVYRSSPCPPPTIVPSREGVPYVSIPILNGF